MTDYYNVGKIVNTQGLKGEVRVISTTDFPEERYKVGKKLMLFQAEKAPIEVTIQSYRTHKNFAIVSFVNHPSINDVENYRGGLLKVPAADLQDLEEHAFYYHEIIGLTVKDENGEVLGEVKEILSPGANDVWVVQRKDGQEIYLPYIESVVKDILLEQKEVRVEIPEGLIDDEN